MSHSQDLHSALAILQGLHSRSAAVAGHSLVNSPTCQSIITTLERAIEREEHIARIFSPPQPKQPTQQPSLFTTLPAEILQLICVQLALPDTIPPPMAGGQLRLYDLVRRKEPHNELLHYQTVSRPVLRAIRSVLRSHLVIGSDKARSISLGQITDLLAQKPSLAQQVRTVSFDMEALLRGDHVAVDPRNEGLYIPQLLQLAQPTAIHIHTLEKIGNTHLVDRFEDLIAESAFLDIILPLSNLVTFTSNLPLTLKEIVQLANLPLLAHLELLAPFIRHRERFEVQVKGGEVEADNIDKHLRLRTLHVITRIPTVFLKALIANSKLVKLSLDVFPPVIQLPQMRLRNNQIHVEPPIVTHWAEYNDMLQGHGDTIKSLSIRYASLSSLPDYARHIRAMRVRYEEPDGPNYHFVDYLIEACPNLLVLEVSGDRHTLQSILKLKNLHTLQIPISTGTREPLFTADSVQNIHSKDRLPNLRSLFIDCGGIVPSQLMVSSPAFNKLRKVLWELAIKKDIEVTYKTGTDSAAGTGGHRATEFDMNADTSFSDSDGEMDNEDGVYW